MVNTILHILPESKFLFNKSPTMDGVIVIVIAHVISHVTNTKCYKIMSGATAWKL